jgi:hypothetical protein
MNDAIETWTTTQAQAFFNAGLIDDYLVLLVSRHASNVGYSLDSLMRASPVVNCQLIRALS